MLNHIASLRQVTDATPSNIHLEAVAGLSQEFRRLLLRHKGGDEGMSLAAAGREFASLYSVPAEQLERYGKLLREQPICDTTRTMVEDGATSALYLATFARAALIEYECRMVHGALEQALAGAHPDLSPLALAGKTQGGANNHTFLLSNTYRNYLRLPGIEPPIDYDELHRRHLYRFTHAREPNELVQEVLAYRNGPRSTEKLIEGKEVLTLGPGRGRDEEQMIVQGGALSVDTRHVARGLRELPPESDRLDLNGEWAFSGGPFGGPGSSTTGGSATRVPGHVIYDALVPEDGIGTFQRAFELPESWAGAAAFLRCAGAYGRAAPLPRRRGS